MNTFSVPASKLIMRLTYYLRVPTTDVFCYHHGLACNVVNHRAGRHVDTVFFMCGVRALVPIGAENRWQKAVAALPDDEQEKMETIRSEISSRAFEVESKARELRREQEAIERSLRGKRGKGSSRFLEVIPGAVDSPEREKVKQRLRKEKAEAEERQREASRPKPIPEKRDPDPTREELKRGLRKKTGRPRMSPLVRRAMMEGEE